MVCRTLFTHTHTLKIAASPPPSSPPPPACSTSVHTRLWTLKTEKERLSLEDAAAAAAGPAPYSRHTNRQGRRTLSLAAGQANPSSPTAPGLCMIVRDLARGPVR